MRMGARHDMTSFVDHCLLQMRQPAAIADLLKGGSTGPYPRLERLITSVFRPDGTSINSIANVSIVGVDPMVLYMPQDRITGSLTQMQPSYQLTDLRADVAASRSPQWAHLLARAEFHLVAEVDPGGIESAVTHAIENIQSFADFQSRFRYIDLDAFLAPHRITTVEQLREAAEYLLVWRLNDAAGRESLAIHVHRCCH